MSQQAPTGKIALPSDLDAVTDIGDEDHSEIDPAAIERIWESVRYWYGSGLHPAIQVCLRRNGKTVLNRAIRHGQGNGPDDAPDAEKIPVTTATPFCVYSAAKAISTTVVHMLVEQDTFPRRPGLRLPAQLHQPRQGPHHDPARDHPQRRRADPHRTAT